MGARSTRPAKRKRPGSFMGFRASDDLKAKLEIAAGLNARSLSAEVRARLEMSVALDPVAALIERLERLADNGR